MIKTISILMGLIGCLTGQVSAQPCQQISIQDATQRKFLNNYIEESERNRCFVGNKGVVMVTRFTNEDGRPSWELFTAIDDRYKENPPVEWAELNGDIILFFDSDSSQPNAVKPNPTPELLDCLDKAIGDRLYIRPPKRDRWIEITGPDGKKRKVKTPGRMTGGNGGNGMRIVFEADGTITMFRSV